MMRLKVGWRRLDQPAVEDAIVEQTARGWMLSGVVVGTWPGQRSYTARYTINCDPQWVTRTAGVSVRLGDVVTDLAIERDELRGHWTLNGEPVVRVEHCTDIDLGFSPITNTLPIRRLHLSPGESQVVRAAWLRFPELTIEPLEQRYTCLEKNRYLYESAPGRFRAPLAVDDAGIVVQYGTLWSGHVRPA